GRKRHANETRKEIARPKFAARKTDLDESHIHPGAASGNPDIRCKGKIETSAARRAMDEAHDGLRAGTHLQNDLGERWPRSLRRRAARHVRAGILVPCQIETRAESLARA